MKLYHSKFNSSRHFPFDKSGHYRNVKTCENRQNEKQAKKSSDTLREFYRNYIIGYGWRNSYCIMGLKEAINDGSRISTGKQIVETLMSIENQWRTIRRSLACSKERKHAKKNYLLLIIYFFHLIFVNFYLKDQVVCILQYKLIKYKWKKN